MIVIFNFSAYGSCRPPHFSNLKSEIWVLRFEVSTFKCEAGNSESWYRERSGRICKSLFYRMFKIQMGLMRFGNQWKITFFTFFLKSKWAWQGLEGSENQFFTKHLKSKWTQWGLEGSEKTIFYDFSKTQMGLTRFERVWKLLFYKTFKIQRGLMRFGRFWRIVFF